MASNVDTVKCGNCQYWTGAREPIFDRLGKPKVNIIDKEGNCEKEGSKFCSQKRAQQLKCKYFSKWTELL